MLYYLPDVVMVKIRIGLEIGSLYNPAKYL